MPADLVDSLYCEDCHVAEPVEDPNFRGGIRAYTLDQDRAKALWAKSEVSGENVDMVAQAIEQLRPVGLGVDRLQFDPLDVLATFWPCGLGIEIDPFTAPQMPANRRKGPPNRMIRWL